MEPAPTNIVLTEKDIQSFIKRREYARAYSKKYRAEHKEYFRNYWKNRREANKNADDAPAKIDETTTP
jgi:hypothetical protein